MPDPFSADAAADRAIARVTSFLRFLRAQGFDVGVRDSLDALRLTRDAGVLRERELRFGLKALACRGRDDWQRFDRLFDAFWHPRKAEESKREIEARSDPRVPRAARGRGGETGLSHSQDSDAEDPRPEEDHARRRGAGRQLALSHTDFRLLVDRDQMRLMERCAEAIARRVRRLRSRRYREASRGSTVNLRRTLRKSLAYGGTPMQLAFRARRLDAVKFVLLLDVSHSMAQYSFFLARFLHGMVLYLPRTEGFVFHTKLHRVTEMMRERDPEALRRRLQSISQLWFGGTRIADSLRRFNDEFANRMLDSRTVVVVFSDGFDSDSPAALGAEIERMRRRVRRVAWLDPMLGREAYVMDEASLLAARPYLDYLGSARTLADLRHFGNYLARL